ncbi:MULTISPECIES: non-ribosomal peptide synthetase module [Cohnella]|mgnify:CR=1 FL=1|uniref:non-ribosomal peptide synthetase module n=1 Tax=Cohnella TaxID=329857 RepID=UPI0009BABDDE|nr:MULTISPECIES: non-ribosomal peptide synthetase module [Cohnella]MBN2984868.1 non-ribosomal peptide synthetase module [Cohnella algarum]
MAQRVATEYVNASLTLSEAEMPVFFALCEAQQLRMQVFVLDNGNHEVVLEDGDSGETIRLTFERSNGKFTCVLSCKVVKPKLTNALRKLVSTFKGDAVVNRIYSSFTMVYHYMKGMVVRIVECKGNELKTVFEHRDTLGWLEEQFKRLTVEEEIRIVRQAVNELLDRRNQATGLAEISDIDERLRHHSQVLFALEA